MDGSFILAFHIVSSFGRFFVVVVVVSVDVLFLSCGREGLCMNEETRSVY